MSPEDKQEIVKIVEAAIMKVSGRNEARSFLTPDQVATELQISAKSVRMMCQNGELRAKQIGKFYRIEQKDFDKYLKDCDLAA